MQTKTVAVLMGSDSDWPKMSRAADTLRDFDVPFEVEVTSAHRTPERTVRYVGSAVERGIGVFVVGAGGAAHLAGTVAAHTTLPVIGVPVSATELKGMDSLLATVQMPSGIPVATVAIDGAQNAALLAIQILAVSDERLREALLTHRREMARKVEAKNDKLKQQLSG